MNRSWPICQNTCKSFRSIASCLNIKGCNSFTSNIFISVEHWFENKHMCAVKCGNCAWKCKLIWPIIFGSQKFCRIYRKLDPGVCFSNNCLHYGGKCSIDSALMDSHILSYTSLETRVINMPQKHLHLKGSHMWKILLHICDPFSNKQRGHICAKAFLDSNFNWAAIDKMSKCQIFTKLPQI